MGTGMRHSARLLSWPEAKAAEAKGGYLATVTSEAENMFVFNLAAADMSLWSTQPWGCAGGDPVFTIGPWLGGSYNAAEGVWQWVTGEPWSYTAWNQGQPSYAGGQEALLFWSWYVAPDGQPLPHWQWDDYWPNGKFCVWHLVMGYVVEYEPLPSLSLTLYLRGAAPNLTLDNAAPVDAAAK